jgi:drug/metabolite transporter (DMT)-like permease
MTPRVRRWIVLGSVFLALGVVLMCTGHHNAAPIVCTLAGLCGIGAVSAWDGPRARRRLDRWRQQQGRFRDGRRD